MSSERFEVVVVGAGISGICAAVALEKRLNLRNFKIYERASDIGGTWRDNVYPGCACDVDSHWYSASFELNPNWNMRLPSQPEVLDYWKRLVDKYQVRQYIQFHTEVVDAEWSEKDQLYHLILKVAGSDGSEETRHVSARVVISAVGGFRRPCIPSLPGLETFKGPMFHSAQWDHSVNLAGKKVVVIGSGSSAAQIVPEISKDSTTSVMNFSRTPMWFISNEQFIFPESVKWIFRNIPFALRLYRNFIMAKSDFRFFAFYKWSPVQPLLRMMLLKYMKANAPEKYHEVLTPTYPPGCKRIIVDPGFLQSLHRPNVELQLTSISEVRNASVVTQSGQRKEYPADVIIFATGFDLQPGSISVRGRNGIELRDHFSQIGGPAAYLATTVPGFPNMYTLLGPNSATGHASIIFSVECQIDHIIKMIKPVVQGSVESFEVKEEASARYNSRMQTQLQSTIWTECNSFYRVGGNGKIIVIMPGPASLFWWRCKWPTYKDYTAVGGERWLKQRWFRTIGWRLAFCALAAALLAAGGSVFPFIG